MNGWIKLHRKLMDSPVWSDPNYLKLWMYCLMKATHKNREIIVGNQVVTLNPGQFITGRISLTDDMNKGVKPKQRLNQSTWWRYLNNLNKWQMLNINTTNKYSIVSIVKWDEYQEPEQQMNIKRTSDEHQMNTNKNVKNEKNDKELFSSSSDQEFSEVMDFYQSNLQKSVTESPFNYELIEQWYNEWGNDLLLAAMKVAAKQEVKGVAFLEGVLKNWKDAGVKSIDDARKYEVQFKASKSRYKNNIVNIPSYESGDKDAKSNGEDNEKRGHVRLFK